MRKPKSKRVGKTLKPYIMKKGILLLLGIFMMVSFVEAKSGIKTTGNIWVDNQFNEAVSFIENGIQFHVFLNGDFDFDTRYARTRRNQRVRVYRNLIGRINRVGNVFINYDFRGNVRRIGSVRIRYNRNTLVSVGNLSVNYDNWGAPIFYGQVRFNDYYYDDNNYFNTNIGIGFNLNLGAVCIYNDPYFYRSEFRNNYRQFREDDNFFYYRANNNANTSRNRILKRRKPDRNVANTGNVQRDRRTTPISGRAQVNRRGSNTNNSTVRNRTQTDRRKSISNQVKVKKRTQTVRKVENKRSVIKKTPVTKKRTPIKKVVKNKKRRKS